MREIKQDFQKVAEVKLIYRNKVKPSQRQTIKSSRDAYMLFLESWNSDTLELHEEFKIMLLNTSNAVLGICPISSGGITGCIADVRLIFATALAAKATAMIVAHNHPSGSNKFSEPDKAITEKLALAGKILDIPILDHVLITKEGYRSMADNGELPMPFHPLQHSIVPF